MYNNFSILELKFGQSKRSVSHIVLVSNHCQLVFSTDYKSLLIKLNSVSETFESALAERCRGNWVRSLDCKHILMLRLLYHTFVDLFANHSLELRQSLSVLKLHLIGWLEKWARLPSVIADWEVYNLHASALADFF